MRKLLFKDVFTLSRILKKSDIKVNFKPEMTQEEIGSDVILSIINGIGNAESETTSLLSDLLGITPDEMANMEIGDAFNQIKQVFMQPGILDFFTQAAKLTK